VPEPGRSPGWRDVATLAAIILGIVFALEIVSWLVPPIGDAFAGFPLTIAILVAGTIAVLAVALRQRPRG